MVKFQIELSGYSGRWAVGEKFCRKRVGGELKITPTHVSVKY